MDGLCRVLLEMRAHEADLTVAVRARDEQRAADAERLVVLRDLIALRIVGIEVILARKDSFARNLATEREAESDRPLDRRAVRNGQRAGMRETDRTRARVGLGEVL